MPGVHAVSEAHEFCRLIWLWAGGYGQVWHVKYVCKAGYQLGRKGHGYGALQRPRAGSVRHQDC